MPGPSERRAAGSYGAHRARSGSRAGGTRHQRLLHSHRNGTRAACEETPCPGLTAPGSEILVGINDKVEPGIERVVCVDALATIDQIVSGCSTMLDPPW